MLLIKAIRLFLAILAVFYWIYLPQFHSAPRLLFIAATIGVLIYFLTRPKIRYVSFTFFGLFVFFYAAVVTTILGRFDYSLPYAILRTFCGYFFGAISIGFLCTRLLGLQNYPTVLPKIIISAAFIQAVICISMLFSPLFRTFVHSLIDLTSQQKILIIMQPFRAVSTEGFASYAIAVLQSVMLAIGVWTVRNSSFRNRLLFYFIVAPTIICSILLSGRTGLLCLLIVFFQFIYQSLCIKKQISTVLVILLSGTLALFFIASIFIMHNSQWWLWISEPFQNFITSGEFSTVSTDDLISHHFFSPEISTWIFGDGLYRSQNDVGSFYMGTDAGLLRHILFFGIPGMLLVLIGFFMLLWNITFSYGDKATYFLSLTLAVIVILAQIKGDIILSDGGAIIRVLMLLFTQRYAKNNLILQSANNRIKNPTCHLPDYGVIQSTIH